MTLSSSFVTVQGNNIGVMPDGQTVAGNHGDGVKINASSHGDLIGQLSSQKYYDTCRSAYSPSRPGKEFEAVTPPANT